MMAALKGPQQCTITHLQLPFVCMAATVTTETVWLGFDAQI